MNTHPEAFVSYLVLTWFLHVNICEYDGCTIFIASVGLSQDRPNKKFI